jgi:glycerol uptake facilitator protein
MTPFIGELVGSALLMWFGCGVVAGCVLQGTKNHNAGWLAITVTWGLAVAMPLYVVGGVHMNPALTVGLALAGEFPWSDVPTYVTAQMLGGILGALLVWVQYLPHFRRSAADPAALLVAFTPPASSPNRWHSVASEMLGTGILVFALMAMGTAHFADGLNPIAIGALVTTIGLALGGTTGFPINPARSLGPRIAHALLPIPGKGSSDFRYGWIPVAGELLGGAVGALGQRALFAGKLPPALWLALGAAAAVLVAAVVADRAVAAPAGEIALSKVA